MHNHAKRELKTKLLKDLPWCYHGRSEQQKYTCSLFGHEGPSGFPQHRHHSRQLDLLDPVNKALKLKEKTGVIIVGDVFTSQNVPSTTILNSDTFCQM